MQLQAKECLDCWHGAQKGCLPLRTPPPLIMKCRPQSRAGGIQASTTAADSKGQLRSHLDLGHQVSETLAVHTPIDSSFSHRRLRELTYWGVEVDYLGP